MSYRRCPKLRTQGVPGPDASMRHGLTCLTHRSRCGASCKHKYVHILAAKTHPHNAQMYPEDIALLQQELLVLLTVEALWGSAVECMLVMSGSALILTEV